MALSLKRASASRPSGAHRRWVVGFDHARNLYMLAYRDLTRLNKILDGRSAMACALASDVDLHFGEVPVFRS